MDVFFFFFYHSACWKITNQVFLYVFLTIGGDMKTSHRKIQTDGVYLGAAVPRGYMYKMNR